MRAETHAARAEQRREQAARAAELRAQGVTVLGIADQLGVGRSYAYDLLNDPDGSKAKARKDRYRGKCSECGGPTSGGNGKAAPLTCHDCLHNRLFGLPINRRVVRSFCGFKDCRDAPADGLMCARHGAMLAAVRAELEQENTRRLGKRRRLPAVRYGRLTAKGV